jgi:tetratricopeptide (TPR) repeat protein
MLQSKQNLTTETEDALCLSFEQMAAYAEQSLSKEARADVEVHLALCAFCREAMEGVLAFSNAPKLRAMVESLNEEIAQRAAPQIDAEESPSFISSSIESLKAAATSVRDGFEEIVSLLAAPARNLRLAYVVAAVFVLGFVSVLYFNRGRANEKLFAEFYQPYPNIASSVRGELTEGKLQDALQQYDAGDFNAALRRLQETLAAEPNDATANFYAGVSYLKVEDSERAVASLQKAIALNDPKFSAPAHWYLALAFLQQNDLAQTRATLEAVIATDHLYKEHAVKLLERMRSSEQ